HRSAIKIAVLVSAVGRVFRRNAGKDLRARSHDVGLIDLRALFGPRKDEARAAAEEWNINLAGGNLFHRPDREGVVGIAGRAAVAVILVANGDDGQDAVLL